MKKIGFDELKILICCHKSVQLPKSVYFLPIQVGSSLTNEHFNIQRDDEINNTTCDNISNKNKSYCELTAVYWAWKNIKKIYPEIKYIGINHYRRFFAINKQVLFSDKIIHTEDFVLKYYFPIEKFQKYLVKGNTILVKKVHFLYPNNIGYCVNHYSDDLRILTEEIQRVFPDYLDSYKKVFFHDNCYSPYNMFVMEYSDFCQYCQWLFTILNDVEKKINIENYTQVQKRIFGYMAERLLNVYLVKNKMKVKYSACLFIDNNAKQNPIVFRILSRVRCDFINFIITLGGFWKNQ